MRHLLNFVLGNWFQLLFLTILVIIGYQHILHYEFVIDDIDSVDKFKYFNDLIPFWKSPAESIRSLLYLLMYNAGQGTPLPFHLVSLLFHVGNVWLIYLILSKMMNKHVALVSALLAAVHPIFVESVTWISGSPYVEYSFFCLLSLYFYMYIDSKTRDFNKKFYIASLLAFVMATLLSEKAIVFPALLLTYELAFGNIKKHWRRLIPFFILACAWVAFYIPKAGQRITATTGEFHLQPGLDNPLVIVAVAITSYFQLLFWPDKLSLYHSELRFSTPELILRGFFVALLIAVIIKLYKVNRMLFFWLSWFVLSLLPTLLPFRLSWVYAERYVYLGSMGILVCTAIGIYQILKRRSFRTLGGLLLIFIISGLLIRTYVRNLDWQTEDHLWLATAETSPSDFKTHNNVGTVYLKRNDIVRAEREFILAITLNKHYADAYYNLGLLYMNTNVFDRAERFYLQAIHEKPTFWQAYNGLSIVYIANKKFEKGEQYAKKTILLNPKFPGGYNNLGLIYQVTDRPEEAIYNFKKTIELNPRLWQTHFNLVLLYYVQNDQKNLNLSMQQAFKNGENSPEFFNRLAQVYITMNRYEDAKQALTKSIELNPNDKTTQEVLQNLIDSKP